MTLEALRGVVRYFAGGAAITLAAIVLLVGIALITDLSQGFLLVYALLVLGAVHLYGRHIGVIG